MTDQGRRSAGQHSGSGARSVAVPGCRSSRRLTSPAERRVRHSSRLLHSVAVGRRCASLRSPDQGRLRDVTSGLHASEAGTCRHDSAAVLQRQSRPRGAAPAVRRAFQPADVLAAGDVERSQKEGAVYV